VASSFNNNEIIRLIITIVYKNATLTTHYKREHTPNTHTHAHSCLCIVGCLCDVCHVCVELVDFVMLEVRVMRVVLVVCRDVVGVSSACCAFSVSVSVCDVCVVYCVVPLWTKLPSRLPRLFN
jgi:hypothetical protein